MKKFFVLVINCSLLIPPLYAEPSQLVTKLMSTPVTMFELGIMKVNNYLASSEDTKGYSLYYSWDTNQFEISKINFKRDNCDELLRCINGTKAELLKNTEFLCWTHKDSNKKCSAYNIMSNFGRIQFATADFHNGKDTSEAVDELKNTTILTLTRHYSLKAKILKVKCEKNLISTDIKCGHEVF
jgi:hypothetical protein